jgi:FkbM family methyltransferase
VLDRDSQIESTEPYLSLVVTARNDDHGGNLLGRMQIFVDGWLAQARRYKIPSELIIVEWNPPADRAPLAEALKWPADTGPCVVRFIEVSREIHSRFKHAESLPLYQMIAKNVGIRRARGRFILATNIDILFSDELAAFIGEQRLSTDRMYRIDRHDAMSDVPAGAPIGEQLDYCRNHLIRVNRREGTFEVTPEGSPVLSAVDVASSESGILLGEGWFSPEQFGPAGCFRWAQESAEILLEPQPGFTTLVVELEPGPATGGRPLDLVVESGGGEELTRFTIESRIRLRLTLASPTPERLWLRASGSFASANSNPRSLCFRVLGLEWERAGQHELKNGSEVQARVEPIARTGRMLAGWRNLQYLIKKLADGGPLVSITVPVSPRLRRLLKSYVSRGGLTGMMLRRPPSLPTEEIQARILTAAPNAVLEVPMPVADTFRCPEFLHTNGCGDFTLIARERWFNLRGYPEFDVFSMNIDSVFCFAAHYGGAREEVLADPMRIYHIEHGSGSGWTPEGQKKLFERIAAKGIPILDNEEVLQWGAQMRRLNSPLIFNHEDWGLANVDFEETTPELGSTSRIDLDAAVIPSLRALVPELRDYADADQTGPEIEAGLLSAARALAYARPLTPYPGWRFDSDWESGDSHFRMRRLIWTYFHNHSRETLLRMNWHKGLTIQIHLGNDLSRPLFIGGCLEPNEFAFLDSVLKEGMVFVDGGANEGLYSLFASRCVGPSGRVFSFEPSQREFQRLECNIRLNGLENVRVVQAALAEKPGEMELRIACAAHAGHNTLGGFVHDVQLLRTEMVSARTLDDFAAEAGLDRVDVVKLDVEGAEFRALQGSRRVLRQMRPTILFEASDAALHGQGSSLPELLEFLRSQEYQLYAFDSGTGRRVPTNGEIRSDNMIGIPMERSEIL